MDSLQYLENMRETHNVVSRWYATLALLYESRSWVELGQVLEQFAELSFFEKPDPVIELYDNVITDLVTDIDLSKFADLAAIVYSRYKEGKGLDFIKGVIREVSNKRGTEKFSDKMTKALSLVCERETERMNLLIEGKIKLDSMIDIDPSFSPDGSLPYLENMCKMHNMISQWYNTLADLYQIKSWVLLVEKLEEFMELPVFQREDPLIDLYHNLITNLDTKIDRLEFAEIAVVISSRHSEINHDENFLVGVIEKLRNTNESRSDGPRLYVEIVYALLLLKKGEEKECQNILEEAKITLDSMTDVHPHVYGMFYWVSSMYHQTRLEFAEEYRNGLLHLAYRHTDKLPESFKMKTAVELSLSALLGESIYNLGELLVHPVMRTLQGTEFEWIYHIIEAFNAGDVDHYQELRSGHAIAWNSHPNLVRNEKTLLEKIQILCLMGIIFSWPSKDRTIGLGIIAKRTKLDVEDVEALLMRCLSMHLIEGIIDEVDRTVYISWVQPRVLSLPQITALHDRLDDWIDKVQTGLSSLDIA